jgi:hypothetical protein
MKPGYSNKLTDETRFSTGPGIMLTVLYTLHEEDMLPFSCFFYVFLSSVASSHRPTTVEHTTSHRRPFRGVFSSVAVAPVYCLPHCTVLKVHYVLVSYYD